MRLLAATPGEVVEQADGVGDVTADGVLGQVPLRAQMRLVAGQHLGERGRQRRARVSAVPWPCGNRPFRRRKRASKRAAPGPPRAGPFRPAARAAASRYPSTARGRPVPARAAPSTSRTSQPATGPAARGSTPIRTGQASSTRTARSESPSRGRGGPLDRRGEVVADASDGVDHVGGRRRPAVAPQLLLAEQLVAADAHRRGDRAGHDEHRTAELRRPPGGGLRPGAGGRLDHDRAAGAARRSAGCGRGTGAAAVRTPGATR